MQTERRSSDRNMLTHEMLLEVLDYNQETGIFIWKIGCRWCGNKVGYVARYINANGYIVIQVGGKKYLAHRLAWLYMKGEWPSSQIDHINGVRDDNRLINLRDVTSAENGQNQRKAHSSNTTGFLGVRFHKATKKFRAQITLDGKTRHLGTFHTPEIAHAAYITAKRQLHPTCTI